MYYIYICNAMADGVRVALCWREVMIDNLIIKHNYYYIFLYILIYIYNVLYKVYVYK